MTRELLVARPEWTIDELMRFLSDHAISGAPVVNRDGEPVGVVSHSDIARNGTVTESTSGRAPEFYRQLEDFVAPEEVSRFRAEPESTATVRDIMTPMVFSVEINATAQEIASTMITGKIHRVFVKEAGRLIGIITATDLLPLVRDA